MILVSNGNKDKKWGSGNNRAALYSLSLWASSYKILSGFHCFWGQNSGQICTSGEGFDNLLHPFAVLYCCPTSVRPFLPKQCEIFGVNTTVVFPSLCRPRSARIHKLTITFQPENTCILSLLPDTFLWSEFWITNYMMEHDLAAFSS